MHLDGEGQEYFQNIGTQESTYEHPMDQHYRQVSKERCGLHALLIAIVPVCVHTYVRVCACVCVCQREG